MARAMERIAAAAAMAEERRGLANVEEAMAFLRLSRASVYALMDKGDLSYCKIGRSRRIPWAALEGLVESTKVG